jgi:hypothetical protein
MAPRIELMHSNIKSCLVMVHMRACQWPYIQM